MGDADNTTLNRRGLSLGNSNLLLSTWLLFDSCAVVAVIGFSRRLSGVHKEAWMRTVRLNAFMLSD
jgi:hypothetical protein